MTKITMIDDIHYCDCSCWACELHSYREWSEDGPGEPGYYWVWGGNDLVDPEVVRVGDIHNGTLAVIFDDGGVVGLEDYRLWIGPMGMPEKRIIPNGI